MKITPQELNIRLKAMQKKVKDNRWEEFEEFYSSKPGAKFSVRIDKQTLKYEYTSEHNHVRPICDFINAFMMEDLKVVHPIKEQDAYISKILRRNHFFSLIKNRVGIKSVKTGTAFIYLYTDENSDCKMCYLEPESTFVKYDPVTEEPQYAFRYYEIENYDFSGSNNTTKRTVDRFVEYVDDKIKVILQYGNNGDLCAVSEVEHKFGIVPIIEFKNNYERDGEIAPIIKANQQINATNTIFFAKYANTLNDLMNFRNMDMTEEKLALLDATGIIAGTDAYIKDQVSGEIKGTVPATVEVIQSQVPSEMLEYLKWLTAEIYHASGCPDVSAESFGNQSGVALEYRFKPLDIKVSIREALFVEAIQKLLKGICNYISYRYNTSIDYEEIQIEFTHMDLESLADKLNAATLLNSLGYVSKETVLRTAGVKDPVGELQKRFEEDTQLSVVNTPTTTTDLIDGPEIGQEDSLADDNGDTTTDE